MFECPEELQGLKAHNLNLGYLYSYWLTIYFIVFAGIYLALQGRVGWLVYLNPYPTIIIGTIIQAGLFILGARAMPIYFIIGVAIWKLILLLLTLAILPVDWTPMTIALNLVVLGIYFLYMRFWHNINPIDLYSCIETNPDYYPGTASEFLRIRFG